MTTAYRHPEAIVSAEWLEAHLADPRLRIFESTVYLDPPEPGVDVPYTLRSGRADFAAGHVPGAGFLDVQAELSDPASPPHLRFTLPAPEALGRAFAARGVGDATRVVLYSRVNMQWATRVWWMLRAVGFDRAAVLDGGFDRWQAEGRPVSTEPCRYGPETLTVRPRPGLFVDKTAVLAAMDDPGARIVNALSPELHRGEDPRYGRPGRIPGSVNVPARSLLDPDALTFLPAPQAARAFEAAGAAGGERTICYCGGGIAASLDAFVLYQLGHEDVSVYDASMSEWARDPSLPIETG